MYELISVVVPVYNVENYLVRCLESIRNQTYPNLEIILVDDGSTDSCPQICDNYAGMDSRVKVLHKKNGGLSSAKNAGINSACGTYIGIVDSDDYIHPDMYLDLWGKLKQTDSDIAVCGIERVYDDNGIQRENKETARHVYSGREAVINIFDAELYLPSVVAVNKLYKKELFEDIRYPEGKLHEDEFTTYRLFYKSNKVVYTMLPYYYYYQRSNSIMGKRKSVFSPDGLEAYERMSDFFSRIQDKEILQLISYRYLCLLKKYAAQLRSEGDSSTAGELEGKFRNVYKRDIRSIRRFRRRFRLRMYRWFRINF